MIRLLRHCRAWAIVAWVAWGGAIQAADLDLNRDGMIRVAVLSVPRHPGGVDASVICSDLESMLKASKPGQPVRVVSEPMSQNRTLIGWWYHPDTAAARAQLVSGKYDWLLLAESEDVVRGYPELYFEGVRAVARAFAAKGTRSALLLLAKPVSTFRDKRAVTLAETVYRVGDGCGVPVIPAAFGWSETLLHNRMSGDSPVRARAYAYLAAAAAYDELAGERLPKAALETDWTTKKTTEVLAVSARDAMRKARVEKQYSGPFTGVVRVEPRVKKRLKIYVPNTAEEDPVKVNLQYILDAAFQDWFWKTPADWYRSGFDRYASAFDLVYSDTRQMDQYLDAENYTSTGVGRTNQPLPCVAVFCRNPEGDVTGADVLRNLESLLIEGYDYAKGKGLVFIPYQLAWARVWQEDPALVAESVPGRANDWISYMLANMIYTLVTDRYQPPPEKEKPHIVNPDHPHGYHERCARIGYDTMQQLAHLSMAKNTVLVRTETYRIDTENPGFVGVRLLDRPSSEVKVFCATDVPAVAALSREALTFDTENFDIEQSVRILPATNRPTLFFQLMVSAQSSDAAIDGANDRRPFLLNYNEDEEVSFTFARDFVSPETGYQVLLAPSQRPSDLVCCSIVQHGQISEEVYLAHDHYSARPVRLYPTAADYRSGLMQVGVRTTSSDRRFNSRAFNYVFRVSGQGAPVPDVRVTAPEKGSVVVGPAFVTARAEAACSNGISELSVYLGPKRLGRAAAPVCSVAVEQGPPQSRLVGGDYTLWAVASTSNGLVVASEPHMFHVREAVQAAAR